MYDEGLLVKAVFALLIVCVLTVGGCSCLTVLRILQSPDPLRAACALNWSSDACDAVEDE
jgi:hypothetical protein